MDQKKVIDALNNIGKIVVKIGTFTPLFKAIFSVKGIIITAIIINSIYMINYFPRLFSDHYLISLIADRDFERLFFKILRFFQYMFTIGVFIVVLKIAKQYLRNNALTALDIAKKQGILSASEHANKVSELHHVEIIEKLQYLEKNGLYTADKTEEIESVLNSNYEKMKKINAIKKAYASHVLTDDEYKDKLEKCGI